MKFEISEFPSTLDNVHSTWNEQQIKERKYGRIIG